MTEFEAFPTDFARIDEVGIVVMTVPKAAHTSIMNALAVSFAPGEIPKQAVKRWRGHKSPSWPSDYLSVGFCRNPLNRFVSCWRDKVAEVDCVRTELARMGCKPGMSLDDLSAIVAKTKDRDLDKHVIPQHYKFFSDGVLRVQELFRYEDLSAAWVEFRELVHAHCGRHLADLPRMNVSRPVPCQWSASSKQLVKDRYKPGRILLGYE